MNTHKLFEHWKDVRVALYEALDKLDRHMLDFTPGPGLWSLKETICHIAGTEKGWFQYAVMRQLSGWEEAEFSAHDYASVEALKILLKEVHLDTESMFQPAPKEYSSP